MRDRRRRAAASVPIALALLLVTAAAPAAGQQVRVTESEGLTIGGFVGATVFAQDRLFEPGNGQNAQFAAATGLDRWWLGGDVRNTRLLTEFRGPEVFGDWRTGALLEVDFFGGFSGTGAFAAEQPLPRLRLAFAEIARGGTTVRLGQDWAPLSGYTPESVTHVAFPLGFGSAGQIGWRFPGLFVFRDLVRAERASLALHLAAMSGGWDDAPDPELPTGGQLGLVPQLQARLDAEGETEGGMPWGAYLVGHVDRKELGADVELPDVRGRRITGVALQAGARVEPAPVTLQGNAYTGRAIGHHAGHISQFGDIRGWGAWLQAGIALSRRWSFWSFAGVDDPRDRDPGPGGRLHNRVFNQMIRVEEGPYQIGLEWLNARTRFRFPFDVPVPPPLAGERVRRSNQLALSMLFTF